MTVTNRSDISLEMAVWLLHDDYDYIPEQNYISATALMKPLRHILLPSRVPKEMQAPLDVEDLISPAMGNALHDSIEKSWLNQRHVERSLARLGYPKAVIERVRVNPSDEALELIRGAGIDPILVYVEQRAFKQVEAAGTSFKVGGKFDMVCEGRVTDTKSTSVWSWVYASKDDDYRLQGSLYRWLNPGKITEDFIRVNFIFTDWSSKDAAYKAEQGYPPRRVMHKDIPLMSLEETEAWVRAKLALVVRHRDTPEHLLPECTPEELWMSDPKYRYFADAAKAQVPGARSTRNFDTLAEAQAEMNLKGKGAIVTVPGTPKRCGYCAAFPICTQKDKYAHD